MRDVRHLQPSRRDNRNNNRADFHIHARAVDCTDIARNDSLCSDGDIHRVQVEAIEMNNKSEVLKPITITVLR